VFHSVGRDRGLASWFGRNTEIRIDDCDGKGACTGACPFAESMDFAPHQLMRLLQIGDDSCVLRSNAAWICTDCMACNAACPSKVDVGGVFAHLRRISIQEDATLPPDVEMVRLLHDAFVEELKGYGRVNDVHVAMAYKARSLDFTDLGLAFQLFSRGRLRPFAARKTRGFREWFASIEEEGG